MSKKLQPAYSYSPSRLNENKILGKIPIKEKCIMCYKIMKLDNHGISENGNFIEAWYKCECGNIYGLEFRGKFVEAYKEAIENGILEKDISRIYENGSKPQEITID